MTRFSRISLLLFGSLVAILAAVFDLRAQTPSRQPNPALPPPPLTYQGLIPGVSSLAEVREKLGAPWHEARWYDTKMLYPVPGRPRHFDAVHLEARDAKTGTLGNVEAVSVPEGWETWSRVREKLGPPEFYLEFHRQALADYSKSGLRFVFDHSERTIGIAYVPHGRARVHDGGRRFLSLRHSKQGPRPTPAMPGKLDGLRAGAVEVDITPTKAALGPAAAEAEFSVRDPIKARCAVLERGELRVALVGADLFGLSRSEVLPIEEALREHGIDHLLLATSHNHAAPDTIGIYGFFPAEYIALVQKRIREGVLAAVASARPVKEWRAASDELALDGARVSGLFRNARNPGIVDPQIAVLQAIGADDRPIVTFVHFACHVEGLEKGPQEASADFPGVLCDKLSRDLGGVAVFLNGAIGGMVSGDTAARTQEEARIAGERLAEEVKRILSFAVPPTTMQFDVSRRRVEIPLTNAKLHLFIKSAGRRALHQGRLATEMFLLRLGDAEIVTMPGELLPELSFEILEEMQGYPRMIVGLVNDEVGYLIPAYDFNADQYEESMSPGPAAGPVVRDQAIRMLKEARDPKRFNRRNDER
jgi:hypothetical protein